MKRPDSGDVLKIGKYSFAGVTAYYRSKISAKNVGYFTTTVRAHQRCSCRNV
jgi:hypothetical protein